MFFLLALLFLLERYVHHDPSLVPVLEAAQVATCKSDLRAIETCLLRYKHNNGKLPTDAEGLQALVVAPSSASSKSPITKASCLIDPWQHGYQYRVVKTASRGYDVFSLGPDGKEGTEDDLHLP